MSVSRRDVLKGAAAAGALVVFARPMSAAAKAGFAGDLGPFVRIDADNRVTIGGHVPDMGQETFTSLPMLVAEELDVAFEQVRVEAMPLVLGKTPYGVASILGAGQSTGAGSNSVRAAFGPLRQAGARARRMLLDAAAQAWRIPADELATDAGHVVHAKSGRRAPYGRFAAAAARLPEPKGELPLKAAKDFKVIGRPQRHSQVARIVTGEPLYALDARLPGMLHATILRCPYLDGEVERYDAAAALATPGVRAVIPLARPPASAPFFTIFPPYAHLAAGVAVLADSLWAALNGRRALKVEWRRGPGAAAQEDSAAVYAETWKRLERGEGEAVHRVGDFGVAAHDAAQVVEARYEVPLVAHACMEPPSAIVDIAPDGSGARAILGTQGPDLSAEVIAAVAGCDPLNVRIELTRMGGGFGRKFQQDMVHEAALLSKAAKAPVRLVWTREDDLQHDLYRPGACHLIQAALDGEGKLTGWRHRLASHSMVFRYGEAPAPLAGGLKAVFGTDFGGRVPAFLTEAYLDDVPAGEVANYQLDYLTMPSAAPRGPWRAPAHVANAFAVQSFLDEIAEATGIDPLEMRLRLLGAGGARDYREPFGKGRLEPARLAAVLRAAAKAGDWGGALPAGRGRGIACHFTFGTCVGMVVEVTIDGGRLTVERVTAAVDAGLIVNPNGARAQIEGAINDALSTALGQAITIRDGQVEQANFDSYAMMRLAGSPRRIDVAFLNTDAPPSGMGEAGMAPLAPALAGAIHAATGRRIRRLPIGDQLA